MLKIDPHRHLGGCIPVSFVWETIQKYDLKHLAETEHDVMCQMTFCPDEPRHFHRFLDKFRILDEIRWTEDLIDASIRAVCTDLAAERIDYTWMDFSINKYMKLGWHKHEAIRFIYNAFNRYRPGGVGLILSLKYESMRASQRQYAKLIENPDVAECLIGLDLVGDEEYFDADFYRPIFRDWNRAGKITRSHVGESQTVANVIRTILDLEASNVAHGFKIMQDPEGVALARDRGVTFDLAFSSNELTGVWTDLATHPAPAMLAAGLRCTLGSDDPVQCSTTLDQEFIVARTRCRLSEEHCQQLRRTAYENSRRFIHSPANGQGGFRESGAAGVAAQPLRGTAAPTGS